MECAKPLVSYSLVLVRELHWNSYRESKTGPFLLSAVWFAFFCRIWLLMDVMRGLVKQEDFELYSRSFSAQNLCADLAAFGSFSLFAYAVLICLSVVGFISFFSFSLLLLQCQTLILTQSSPMIVLELYYFRSPPSPLPFCVRLGRTAGGASQICCCAGKSIIE